MRILSTTFNLLANATSKLKFLPENFRSPIFHRFPAPAPALSPNSKQHDDNNNNNNKNLMLMVRYILNKTTCEYCTISTENNSFQVVEYSLPNSSILRSENYYKKHRNANYIIRACSNYKWMLLTCRKSPGPPYELLWDPKTNEMKPLPRSPFGPPLPSPRLIYTFGFGVGFDPRTSEDYKVVRTHAFEYEDFYRVQSEVFSLRTDSWKEIVYPHDLWFFNTYENLSLHINGFFYWLAHNSTTQASAIIQFDFVEEKFRPALIPMPKSEKLANVNNVVPAEFHGSLAAVVIDFGPEKMPCFEIWVWGNNDEWSLVDKFYIPADDGVLVRLLGLYKNNKALIQDFKGDLLLYDCETRELENIGIRDQALHLQVFPFGDVNKINLSSSTLWFDGIFLCSSVICYAICGDLISYV